MRTDLKSDIITTSLLWKLTRMADQIDPKYGLSDGVVELVYNHLYAAYLMGRKERNEEFQKEAFNGLTEEPNWMDLLK